jgi:hypothetical protein
VAYRRRTGLRGVKFAAYSDELTAGNGALRLVPGSHHPEQNARLSAYSKRRVPASVAGFAAYQAGFPGYVAATSPGPHDVHRGLLGVEELVAARWTIWADWFFHGWHWCTRSRTLGQIPTVKSLQTRDTRSGEADGEGLQAVHEADGTPAEFFRGDRQRQSREAVPLPIRLTVVPKPCGCRKPMPPGDIHESRLRSDRAAGHEGGPGR